MNKRTVFILKIKIHNSCEIEYYVEPHLCKLCVVYGRSIMSAQMLEVSPLGVGTVLRLERDAWSMVT